MRAIRAHPPFRRGSRDDARAAEGDQPHRARLARLEARRGAGGDVEAHPARGGAVEAQGGIRLGEVVVAADLDRPVAGIGTSSSVTGRPAFSSISPGAGRISPGIIGSAGAR
jgi:hypothetical protein